MISVIVYYAFKFSFTNVRCRTLPYHLEKQSLKPNSSLTDLVWTKPRRVKRVPSVSHLINLAKANKSTPHIFWNGRASEPPTQFIIK